MVYVTLTDELKKKNLALPKFFNKPEIAYKNTIKMALDELEK